MGYIGKPQLEIQKVGKTVRFKTPEKKQYYVLIEHLRGFVFGSRPFIYANEYIPHKTYKDI